MHTDITSTPNAIAFSIPGAVRASGLSRSMIYAALKDGRLTARKAGARTIIEDAELRRFIAGLPTMHVTKAA
jgi:hypothetical protein